MWRAEDRSILPAGPSALNCPRPGPHEGHRPHRRSPGGAPHPEQPGRWVPLPSERSPPAEADWPHGAMQERWFRTLRQQLLSNLIQSDTASSQRNTLRIVGTSTSVYRWKSMRRDVQVLDMCIKEICRAAIMMEARFPARLSRYRDHRRARALWLQRRVHMVLRRQGLNDNHKPVYRLHQELSLSLRLKRPRRKKRPSCVSPSSWPIRSTRLFDGRKLRMLTVVCRLRCIRSLALNRPVLSLAQQLQNASRGLPLSDGSGLGTTPSRTNLAILPAAHRITCPDIGMELLRRSLAEGRECSVKELGSETPFATMNRNCYMTGRLRPRTSAPRVPPKRRPKSCSRPCNTNSRLLTSKSIL